MKISVNSIRGLNKQYGCADDIAPNGVDELATKIGAQLGAIEEISSVGAKYEGVIIAKVVSCEQHPNADRLHVCKIDDGGKAQNVARDENGHVQVVCGAPNVREGLTVVWLPPGSTVPDSVGKDPFVLEARELRGVVSNGMLASPRELALGDSHEGILEIDGDVSPGTDFAEQFGLKDDFVLDIENKMFTHRPDCFGFLGVSRELAGIQHMPFKSPEWYRMDAEIPAVEAEILPFEFRNELPELVPRFTAIVLRDVEVKPSPTWLVVELAKVGLRSINNIVDYTNFFMLLTGQPLHAYDYDKVKSQDGGDKATIVVRHPRDGEKITLLNGKEIEPRSEAIMIATESELIGIGGVMGGADTEVDGTTENIIIEVANFDMYSIRRTSMAHGLFTDAVTRFNKGQSPLQNRAVLAKIVDEIRQFAGGKVASELIDDIHFPEEVRQRGSVHPPVTVSVPFINERLGLRLSAEEMRNLLSNVEFDVQVEGDNLTVKAPFWRTDIEIPEDVVEEVGRLYGFDHLPLELPTRPMAPAAKNFSIELKQRLRDTLSQAGANEILAYSFVHGNLLQKVEQDVSHAFQLSNALSPDLQYYRLSLIPSLLERVHANIKAGYGELALFEIGKAHSKDELDEEGLPKEFERLALVFAAEDKVATIQYQGAAYYQALRYLKHLSGTADYRCLPLHEVDLAAHELTHQMAQPFEPNRSAVIHDGQRVVGVIGEYRLAVRKALKLPEYSAGFEVFASALASAPNIAYKPLSRYPSVEQDICLKVSATTTYEQVHGLVRSSINEHTSDDMTYSLGPIDIYQRQDDSNHKQVTLRLAIASYTKTLRDGEVNAILDKVAAVAAEKLQAERV
jgi:phenylalanyl-tRNA synthetase beta chain